MRRCRWYNIIDENDKGILAAADLIQSMIAGNRRININDVMLLYGTCTYSFVISDQQDVFDHQTMICVPDIFKCLQISISDRTEGDTVNVSAQDPIRPALYVQWEVSRVPSPASALSPALFSDSNDGDGAAVMGVIS